MEIVILLSSIFALFVFLFVIYYFIRKVKFESFFKVDLSVLLIGIVYLLFSAVLISWAFGRFNFDVTDFLIVYAFVLAVEMICLINILYQYNKNKRILYSILTLVVVVPISLLNIIYLHLIIPISLFVILLSFLIFSDSHQRTTTFLMIYTVFSLLAYVVSLIWQSGIPLLILVSNLLFFLFIQSFLTQLRHRQIPFLPPLKKKDSPIVHFLKHFIFIIIITNFIFIGTVGVHELGHLLAASASDNCEGNKIYLKNEEKN